MLSNLKSYVDAKWVVPGEAQRFLDPIRDDYERLKQQYGHKNYFKNDLGIKGSFIRARMLGLHKQRGLKILDIGTGSAMFPAVCNHYGHDATGSDVPENQSKTGFFHECADLFGIEVLPLTITSPNGLPGEYHSRWDLITGFLINFDGGWDGSGNWTKEDWVTFIRALFDKSLNPGGRLCFLPNAEKAIPLGEAAEEFSGVTRFHKWGVWIFTKP